MIETPEQIAASLRAEASALLEATDLVGLLANRFGECVVVGSHALDLMSWRDIDLSMPVERDALRRFVETLPLIHRAFTAHGFTLFRAVFNDEYARPRGDYGSGYYWGLRAAAGDGPSWKLDLWGWQPETHHRKVEALERLRAELARVDRGLVLGLKHEAQRLPGFRDAITSYDVYRLVIGGGSTLDELVRFSAENRSAPVVNAPSVTG